MQIHIHMKRVLASLLLMVLLLSVLPASAEEFAFREDFNIEDMPLYGHMPLNDPSSHSPSGLQTHLNSYAKIFLHPASSFCNSRKGKLYVIEKDIVLPDGTPHQLMALANSNEASGDWKVLGEYVYSPEDSIIVFTKATMKKTDVGQTPDVYSDAIEDIFLCNSYEAAVNFSVPREAGWDYWHYTIGPRRYQLFDAELCEALLAGGQDFVKEIIYQNQLRYE